MHIAGKNNDLGDIPSRSFHASSRWFCPTDYSFLTKFNAFFPLPQNLSWTLCHLPSKIITKVILELWMHKLPLDVWLQLPQKDTNFGTIGKPMSNHSTSTLSYSTHPSQPKLGSPLVLINTLGKATTVSAIELLVAECRQR